MHVVVISVLCVEESSVIESNLDSKLRAMKLMVTRVRFSFLSLYLKFFFTAVGFARQVYTSRNGLLESVRNESKIEYEFRMVPVKEITTPHNFILPMHVTCSMMYTYFTLVSFASVTYSGFITLALKNDIRESTVSCY